MSTDAQEQQGKTIHPAQVAATFMTRADLKGGEVEAYAQTFNWLQGIINGEIVVLSKEQFDQLVVDQTSTKEVATETPEVPALELEEVDSED